MQSPTHTYASSGAYTVSLAVGGPNGGDAITRTSYIAIRDPVPSSAAFTAAPTRGPVPLAVVYTNTSTGDYSVSFLGLRG